MSPRQYDRRSEPVGAVIERVVVGVVSAAAIALMIWVGTSLTTSIETGARTDERIKNTNERIQNMEKSFEDLKAELKDKMHDRYTAKDADARAKVVDSRIGRLETWMGKTEERLDRVERDQVVMNGK